MAKYLIDTQILIWFELESPQLKSDILNIIADTGNEIFVSQISLMEITIKQKTGRLPQLSWDTKSIVQQLGKDNIQLMPIEIAHIDAYKNIPFFDNHRDPFDRFLLATCLAEDVPIISADANFTLYRSVIHLIEA